MMLPVIVVVIVIDIGVIVMVIAILFSIMMGVMRRMMVMVVVWLTLVLFGMVRAIISVVRKAFSSDKSHYDHTHRHSSYYSHLVVLISQMLHYLHKLSTSPKGNRPSGVSVVDSFSFRCNNCYASRPDGPIIVASCYSSLHLADLR
jgi:hypothetical protein